MTLPYSAPLRPRPRWRRLVTRLLFAVAPLVAGCVRHDHPAAHDHSPGGEAEAWAVTAWGDRYEVFLEVAPLVMGEEAEAHTHVTSLADFAPLPAAKVTVVLRGADGAEEVFAAPAARRPGIFPIVIAPRSAGERELLLRIAAAAGDEEIAGGRVRVGGTATPGGLVAPPAAHAAALAAAGAAGGEEIAFPKEQQWSIPFLTEWATAGELTAVRVAPARVVARPGGDRVLTAPADGVVLAAPFPHPGLRLRAGATLFALTPRLDPERSLAALEGEQASAEAELALARAEAARAQQLAGEGIVSAATAERAAAALAVATARAEAASRDVATARRARGAGGSAAEAVRLAAPFDGAVAAVQVSAGQAVEAGDQLGRFVASGPPWIEAWVAPGAVAGLEPGPTRVSLSTGGGAPPAGWTDLAARLVAIAPALDAASGRRTLLLALSTTPPGLAIGQSIELELQGTAPQRGVVVPASAVVDDAGVAVIYVQSGGETLRRREVRVVARAADRLLVAGVAAGERIVTVGGDAVRRASLVSAGAAEAHVH